FDQGVVGAALAADSRFAANSKRAAAREELRTIIVAAFRDLTAEEVIARLDAAQIANARMNDMHEVWEHAQLKARARWTEVETPAGRIAALIPPALPSTITPRMDPVPALVQHTDAILRALDFDPATIEPLRAAGA